METSFCSKCKVEKDISEFGWNKQRDRPNYWCKPCRVSYNAKNEKKHPERVKKSRKKTKLKALYGISVECFEKQLEFQEGKCAICSDDLKEIHVDHCHDTGTLRGLLCPRCNHGLGHFKDNIEALEQAVRYIKSKGVWN